MAERSQNDVIKSVYYGRDGFGNVTATYEKAKTKDKTITVKMLRIGISTISKTYQNHKELTVLSTMPLLKNSK